MQLSQIKMNSKIGPLYLVASPQGLRGIFWRPLKDLSHQPDLILDKILHQAEEQIQQYLSGQRKEFDLKLDAVGTPFQKKVWHQLSLIPYGVTRSYKEIALALGDANASRAVGTANGKNPLSIVVPCHRVISSDGTLGGYAGGLPTKTRLLDLEQKGLLP